MAWLALISAAGISSFFSSIDPEALQIVGKEMNTTLNRQAIFSPSELTN
jgi:hypothetical protein